MKRFTAILLSCLMIITVFQGCESKKSESSVTNETKVTEKPKQSITVNFDDFKGLDDSKLKDYIESTVYSDVIDNIDNAKYAVINVESTYISKEYLEETSYNSKENIYFGYSLSDIKKEFTGKKYVFTLSKDGTTTVEEFQDYDDTNERIIKNVAIGTGVILLCVTVSAITGGVGLPAASVIFAASAKSASIAALSSAGFGAATSGIITAIETKDFNKSINAALLNGSEGFKWGAISGAIAGGLTKATALHGATTNGLTMNEVAQIQKESKYPLDVIKQFKSMNEFNVYKEANLTTQMVSGKTALIPTNLSEPEFLNFKSELPDGSVVTNLQRMSKGYAPLDPATNKALQLHHIGQKSNGTLAVLTAEQHQGNAAFLNTIGKETEIDRNAFAKIREAFWISASELFQ